MVKIKKSSLRKAKGRHDYTEAKAKREAKEIREVGEEGWVERSLENKTLVLTEEDGLDELQAIPVKHDTIEYWITPVGRAKIQAWKRGGLSKAEIAQCMGVTQNTLWRWEREFSLIREAMSLGLEEMVMSAEHALIQKALGYEQKEKVVTYDNLGKQTVRESTKYIAPDYQALKFLLTNMKPEVWRDKQEVAVDTSSAGKFASMTDEELAQAVKKFGDINGEDMIVLEGDYEEV